MTGPPFVPRYYNISTENFAAGGIADLPISMIALQKMSELQAKGISVFSTMLHETAGVGLPATFNDANTTNGQPTMAQYLKRLLLADDTEAFDRLYEFAGTDYIAAAFANRGYPSDTIAMRRSTTLSSRQNLTTNPVLFYDEQMKLQYKQAMQVSKWVFASPANPPSISMNLPDAQVMLQTIFFPQSVNAQKRFPLTTADQTFLKAYLGLVPRQSSFPYYGNTMSDAWDKYLYYGGAAGNRDTRFKVYNVSSLEDGRITDVAYFADLDRKVEFMLSVTSKISLDEDGNPVAR